MARSDLTIDQVIKDAVEGFLLDVHTQARGNVVSYDESTHTCEVRFAAKRPVPDGEGGYLFEELPNVPNVPVAWPSAGGFMLHWPLAVGDSVFVTFDEVDVQRWEGSGAVCEPGNLERFGLSCPLAHPYSRAGVASSGAGMVCPSPFSFGGPAAQFVAIAAKVDAALSALKAAVASAAATEAGAGGLGGTTALASALAAWPPAGGTAGTKLKAEP